MLIGSFACIYKIEATLSNFFLANQTVTLPRLRIKQV